MQSAKLHIMKPIFFLFLIFLVACTPTVIDKVPPETEDEIVFCTMDVKICPDGSAVGRIAPDCEFASCPELGKDYCETVNDCVCQGIDTETNDCFVGNKNYYDIFVDKETECSDFCTGIDGRMQTVCAENKCILVRTDAPPEGGPWISIVATPSKAEVPVNVKFTAKLRGADPNDRRFYCAREKWVFGDGEAIAMTPGCPAHTTSSVIETSFETTYRYEKPGKYDVTFSLNYLNSTLYSMMVLPELLPPECDEDSDCVKAQCCHAADCIIKEKRADCSSVFCTQECMPGTLDCGGGCACVYGRCTGTNFVEGELIKETWPAFP